MSIENDPILRRVEIFLNEQRADITNFRIILQTFLWNMVRNRPEGAAMLADMKEQILAHIQNIERGEGDPQDFERMLQLQLIRAEEFFQPVEKGLAPAGNARDPKASN